MRPINMERRSSVLCNDTMPKSNSIVNAIQWIRQKWQEPITGYYPRMSPSTKVAFNIIWWWKWWFCQKYMSDTTLMFQKSQGQPPVGCFRDPVFFNGISTGWFSNRHTPGRLESDRDYHVMVRERCTWVSQMTGELWRDVTDDRSVGYVLDDHLRGRGKRWVI